MSTWISWISSWKMNWWTENPQGMYLWLWKFVIPWELQGLLKQMQQTEHEFAPVPFLKTICVSDFEAVQERNRFRCENISTIARNHSFCSFPWHGRGTCVFKKRHAECGELSSVLRAMWGTPGSISWDSARCQTGDDTQPDTQRDDQKMGESSTAWLLNAVWISTSILMYFRQMWN